MSRQLILYNGSSGGLGRHLADAMRQADHKGHALLTRLEDQRTLTQELEQIDPGEGFTFIHLAARVSVPACEADPEGAHLTNVSHARATVETVLDWGVRRGASARVIYVSTGHVYAAPPRGSKLAEEARTEPRSVYAQTKLAAEQALAVTAADRGVPMLVARVFGLLGPRQAEHYILPSLIQRATHGRLDGIPGLDFVRDYLDARDVSDDLVLLASVLWPESPTIVNVCSGVGITIRELLRAILRQIRPSAATDLAAMATSSPGRPGDVQWLVGNPARFIALTGNSPQRRPLAMTIRDAAAAMKTDPS